MWQSDSVSSNRLTIDDLAHRLNLSPAAVSYALNNRPGVSEHTRIRVQELARELGWYPSSSARALSQSRAGSIGIALSRSTEMIGTEPYYMQVIAGVERVLVEADMSLLFRMVTPQSGQDIEVYKRWAGQRRVDGVILFDELVDDPRLTLLEKLGLPTVLQGRTVDNTAVHSVEVDDEHVARLIVDTFADLGHRSLLHLTGPLHLVHELRRREAVVSRAEQRGLAVEVIEGDYTIEGARATLSERLRGADMPTAIACSNDMMSVGSLEAIEDARLSVPDQISLISWDDSLICSVSRPKISAVDRNPLEYGERTARALLHIIAGEDVPEHPVPASELVTRGTTGPVPR